jgi:hypothetical protein
MDIVYVNNGTDTLKFSSLVFVYFNHAVSVSAVLKYGLGIMILSLITHILSFGTHFWFILTKYYNIALK